MAYFDLVKIDLPDKSFAKLLGFKKVFTTKEISLNENLNIAGGRCIVSSSESGILGRAIRRSNVIGVMIKDSEMLRQVVEEVKDNEKILFFNACDLTCVDTHSRLRNLYRMRNLLKFSMRAKAKTSLITLSEDKWSMLSSLQMVEIGKFLSASEEYAKKMLSSLGDIDDN